MAPPGDGADDLDAVFLSPHKFVGGPGTPGVLVARRALFHNRVPSVPGGGHGGLRQPDRARLPRRDRAPRGGRHARRSSSRSARGWCSSSSRRWASRRSASARSRSPTGRCIDGRRTPPSRSWAATTFRGSRSCRSWCVTTAGTCITTSSWPLLNDLFGIQARGGCSCAGPYGHRLLGIDLDTSHEFERADRERMRGHQAGLGARELQLLHQRDGVRLRARCGGPGGDRGVAPAAPLPVRADERDVATRRRATRAADDAPMTCGTTSGAMRFTGHRHRAPESALGRLPRGSACGARRTAATDRPRRARGRGGRLRAPSMVLAARGDRRPRVNRAQDHAGSPARVRARETTASSPAR